MHEATNHTPETPTPKPDAKATAKWLADKVEAAVQAELQAAAAAGHAEYIKKCSALGRSPFGHNRKARRTYASQARRAGGSIRAAIHEGQAAKQSLIRTTGPMQGRSPAWWV